MCFIIWISSFQTKSALFKIQKCEQNFSESLKLFLTIDIFYQKLSLYYLLSHTIVPLSLLKQLIFLKDTRCLAMHVPLFV